MAKGRYYKNDTSPFDEAWVEVTDPVIVEARKKRSDRSLRAARRIRYELARAEDGRYLDTGWYSYIDRRDVEAVIEELIGR